jgi:hypothetical protein
VARSGHAWQGYGTAHQLCTRCGLHAVVVTRIVKRQRHGERERYRVYFTWHESSATAMVRHVVEGIHPPECRPQPLSCYGEPPLAGKVREAFARASARHSPEGDCDGSE